jgi:hypothetical protein
MLRGSEPMKCQRESWKGKNRMKRYQIRKGRQKLMSRNQRRYQIQKGR